MSCSCGDTFCDGYNCNNNGGGAVGIIIIILLYPYLPFMVVGYEWMDKLSNGVNIFKWIGAIVGFALGIYFYFNIFRKFVNEVLNIRNDILYWIICYGLSSVMFIFLNSVYSQNHIVKIIRNFWMWFSIWAISVS